MESFSNLDQLYRPKSVPGFWTLAAAVALIAVLVTVWYWKPVGIAGFYFVKQDVPIACAMIAAGISWRYLTPRSRWNSEVRLSRRTALMGAALLFVLGTAGHWLVLAGYDLSRDQSMATFAARQIGQGTLVTPVPEAWRPFGQAMMPLYYYGLINPSFAWASAYLPVNSAIQALGDVIGHRSIANPLVLIAGLAALWQVARIIWPERRDAAVVAVLFGATSAQLIANAMSSYAMVGHFALNMVWLALFLRNDWLGAIGALAIGFLAMGLHQFHFHPMFAAPFLLWLVWRRQWSRAAFYGFGYLAILLVWTQVYPTWLVGQAASVAATFPTTALPPVVRPTAAPPEVDLGLYIARKLGRLFEFPPRIWLFNLVRFFTWENLALIPLAVLALPSLWRRGEKPSGPFVPIAVACLVGMLLPVHQGHGFGYRYLSGAIGCFCLLASYGWVRLVPEPGPARAWAMLKAACCFTLAVTLPLQLFMLRDMVAPYARLHAAIMASDADVVLVDTQGGFLAQDLVQNSPDFEQRPKIMDLSLVPIDALEPLCRGKRVMLVDRRHYRAVDMRVGNIAPLTIQRLVERRPVLDRLSCAPPMPFAD